MSEIGLIDKQYQLQLATHLFTLGARLPLVMHETQLSRATLRRLHIELMGTPPRRGVLPFSLDWFLQWRHNIHASLFANIHAHLDPYKLTNTERLIESYRHYLREIAGFDTPEPTLTITRAWTLLRFCRQRMLQLTPCHLCKAQFISTGHLPSSLFTCGVCKPPPHAGRRQLDVPYNQGMSTKEHVAELI